MSSIPEDEALEIDWKFSRVFIVKNPAVRGYKYLLREINTGFQSQPGKGLMPLVIIVAKNNNIKCSDSDQYGESWLKLAQWDFSGIAVDGRRVPNLLKAPFMVTEQSLVI